MNKKYALILASLLTFLIANSIYLFNSATSEGKSLESVVVSRVIDGDTLQLDDGRKIRLLNINSPEKTSQLYKRSFEFLKTYEHKQIYLDEHGQDKYKRTLARVYDGGLYINLELVKYGLASKFLVSKEELKDFSSAEELALENEYGIWQHSIFYGCISVDIDQKNEKVLLESSCDNLNIFNWTIKDESRKEYHFWINNLQSITIHSSYGQDTERDIYWKSKTDIWNNDRDTLYIFDNQNKIVISKSYGY